MMAHAVAVTRQRQKDPWIPHGNMRRHRHGEASTPDGPQNECGIHAISAMWWNKSKISIAWRVEPRPGRKSGQGPCEFDAQVNVIIPGDVSTEPEDSNSLTAKQRFISPVRPLRVMAHAEAVTHSCESPLLLQEPREFNGPWRLN